MIKFLTPSAQLNLFNLLMMLMEIYITGFFCIVLHYDIYEVIDLRGLPTKFSFSNANLYWLTDDIIAAFECWFWLLIIFCLVNFRKNNFFISIWSKKDIICWLFFFFSIVAWFFIWIYFYYNYGYLYELQK